jgi:cholesterol oxidase
MIDASPGVRFQETMTGGLALGVESCPAGAAVAKEAGHILAMHATVTIDDLAAFVEDATHTGQLTGTIDYPPFGTSIPCHSGKFNLFSPTDDPFMKHMIYELAFEHEGMPYYLAGHKEVKDDPGFDLWSDTTTLYTRLYEGGDKTGPQIGAGVLTLGIGELVKLVSSMEVLHTDGLADKASTLTGFGRFFLGELWDTYVKGGGVAETG